MYLYHLVSNIWKFSFKPKYESGDIIPSSSLWQFSLDGSLNFLGKTYGEGHSILSWRFSNNKFYIEGNVYGLIEFKFDELMINISGESILDDNTIILFKGEITKPFDDNLFYSSYKTLLKNRTWRLSILGAIGLFYFRFEDDILYLYDIFGMKFLNNADKGFQDEDWEDGLKCIQYIYILEGKAISIHEKQTVLKVGTLYLNDSQQINGILALPFHTRKHFVELTPISYKDVENDLKDICDELRIIK